MGTTIKTRNSKKWWALAAITLAVLAVGIDQTVLSLALPTLAKDLHATNSELQWFVAAFSLALCAALLPAGVLGDRFGRKKLLLVSLAIFGIGSLACAFSTTPTMLIAARVLLGIGAAFLVPLTMAVIPVIFVESERTMAVGVWGAANFLAFPIGPILGGWILTKFWWGAVFLINVPVVILAIIAVAALLPESRSEKRPGLDPLGVLFSSLGLVGLTYGVIQAGQNGWGRAQTLVPLAAGAFFMVGFALWERSLTRRPEAKPLIDLELFRSPQFTWGTILAMFSIFAMSGLLFTLPQYSVAILGTDSMGAGLRLLPMIGGLVIGAVSSNRFAARAGAKVTAALGFALVAAGMFAGTATSVGSGFGYTAAWTAVVGAGMGFALSAAAAGALGALPVERSGVGSSVMQAVQKIGLPFGTAILGAVYSNVYRAHLDVTGVPAQAASVAQKSVFAGLAAASTLKSTPFLESVRTAFMYGMGGMLWVCGGTAALCVVLTVIFLPRRAAASSGSPAVATPGQRVE